MTSRQFNPRGAVDLSALKRPEPSAQQVPNGGDYTTDVSAENFEDLVRASSQYPVILEFTSNRAQGAADLDRSLTDAVNGHNGRLVLGRVDVDQNPELAQQIGVQAIPTVIALLGGQAAPLFQGVQPDDQVRSIVDQIQQAAVANGMAGIAEPFGGEVNQLDPAEHPRYAQATEAMAAGDFAKAAEEYQRLVTENPQDEVAEAGLAQAELLGRVATVDFDQTLKDATQSPDDLDRQLLAADVEVASGLPRQAFTRLVNLIRSSTGADREQIRLRLLQLFATVGNQAEDVVRARRDLMSALF